MNWKNNPWAGVFPATLCPFNDDESIDEEGLRTYFRELASVPGIDGLVCNGHTGEIMSLRPSERDRITSILAETVQAVEEEIGRKVKAITGVSAEGSLEAIDHALEAKASGADAILLMPPHHWLRFGRSTRTAVGYFEDVAAGADIPIIIHQYPAWTKAGYSLDEMLAMIKLPQVVCIKMGTREMSRWLYDFEKIKEADPDIPILTCQDEYLLPTLLEGADGALVGFAGFIPELIVEMVHASLKGDLIGAKAAQKKIEPLNRIVYSFGEPGSGAHQRMKFARWALGKFSNPKMRRPLRDLPENEKISIRERLTAAGCTVVR